MNSSTGRGRGTKPWAALPAPRTRGATHTTAASREPQRYAALVLHDPSNPPECEEARRAAAGEGEWNDEAWNALEEPGLEEPEWKSRAVGEVTNR